MVRNRRRIGIGRSLGIQKGGFDLNFGIGRGLTSASEKWVAKMIVGIPFK